MRVLFTTTPLPGHLFPMVPLAWALRAAGHEVLMAAPENFAGTVGDAGLPVAVSGAPVGFEEFMLHDRDGRRLEPPRDPVARKQTSGRAWGRLAARTLEATLRLAEDWAPDLMICEPTEYAGQLAAARTGIPWVEHALSFDDFAASRGPAGLELEPERARLGVDAMPEPGLVVDVRPPSMYGPQPARGLPMRFVPYSGRDVPAPWFGRPRERPRICLTLGSMLPRHGRADFPGRLAGLMKALPGLGAEVVVAVDDDIARSWGTLPDGVVAAGTFPLERALASCDLLISHGGPGTVLTGLVRGIPQLTLPQTSDQFINTERLTGRGAGLGLSADDASTDAAVLDAAGLLLEDPAHRACARAVAEEIAGMDAPAALVPDLERLALAGRTTAPLAQGVPGA